jgi:hypothetical protein
MSLSTPRFLKPTCRGIGRDLWILDQEVKDAESTVVGREKGEQIWQSPFDAAAAAKSARFYWRLTRVCVCVTSVLWTSATFSYILQLGKIRESGVASAYCADLYHHLGAKNLSLRVCKRDISRLPGCCLSCDAGQMVCMPFSRHTTGTRGPRAPHGPHGQFLFLAFYSFSVCLLGARRLLLRDK